MSEPMLLCDKAVPDLSKAPACVLSDEAIMNMVHESLYPDSLCWGEENGQIVGGLWGLAEKVNTAMRDEETVAWTEDQEKELSQQGRIILALRAFYRLGVLRGCEAYRNEVLNNNGEPVFAELPFELDPWDTADIMEDLNETDMKYLDKFLALVGVSITTAADRGKENA